MSKNENKTRKEYEANRTLGKPREGNNVFASAGMSTRGVVSAIKSLFK